MRRTYTATPAMAVEMRLSAADRGESKPVVGGGASESRSVALLALTPGATAAAEPHWRRAVARRVMVSGHGCTGKACAHPAHDRDKAVMTELLDALRPG